MNTNQYPFDPRVPVRNVVLRESTPAYRYTDVTGNPSQTESSGFSQRLRHVEDTLLDSEIPSIEQPSFAEIRAIERRVRKALYG